MHNHRFRQGQIYVDSKDENVTPTGRDYKIWICIHRRGHIDGSNCISEINFVGTPYGSSIVK